MLNVVAVVRVSLFKTISAYFNELCRTYVPQLLVDHLHLVTFKFLFPFCSSDLDNTNDSGTDDADADADNDAPTSWRSSDWG